MAEVKFKFVGDDSELRKKLANLARMQSEISDKFDANLTKSLSTNIDKALSAVKADAELVISASRTLRDAQLANIESIRKTREERAKELSELLALQQIEQEHKAALAEKQRATEALIQEEKQLSISYKNRQLEIQEYNKTLREEAEARRKAAADQKDADKIAKESLKQKSEEAKRIAEEEKKVLKEKAEEAKKAAAEEKKALKQKAEELKKAAEEEKKASKAAKDSEKARKDAERQAEKAAKAAEKRRKELEKENSEYYQLNKALNNVRKEAKDVLAEMFKLERQGLQTSVAYEDLKNRSKDLVEQTQLLDKGIKKIDATLGLHQRNVGDYGQAFGNISPVYANIDSALNVLGTSIKELAEGGGSAFAELGETLIEFGTAVGKFLLSPIGIAITILTGLFLLFQKNKQTVIDFNNGLLNVSKTTGLTGVSLQLFSDAIINLSRSLKTVSTDKLLEYASVAGQLGVKGSQNILAFSEALAKLETASDISGEEGASQIARLLQLVDGGVQNIRAFGDEIVKLGNNFPATESQILANATRIAQSTGIYKLGRQEILAYATATKSVGVEAELVGSSIGRTLGVLEKAIRSGQGVDTILKLVGGTQTELSNRFRQDASGVLMDFIAGLNRTGKTASDFNKNLEAVGITAQKDKDVIGSLASKGYEVLADAMKQVKEASGSMDDEFSTASEKLVNQSERVGIAWDNLILSIENGQGAIGKASVAVVGFVADLLDSMADGAMASDKLVESYYRFEKQTKQNEEAVKPLLKRYDELKSKTNLNKDEHIELRDIIQKIASFIPTAITEFDKYGQVIDINKKKITQFNEAQKQLVKDMNISTRKSLNEELADLKKERDGLVATQKQVLGWAKNSPLLEKATVGGIEYRTEQIAVLTDKMKKNLQRQKDLGGTLSADDSKFLERFQPKAPESTPEAPQQEEAVKKNKEYWDKIVSDTQEAIDALEVSQKGSDIWKSLSKKLAEAQKNVDKYSLSKDESASKSAGKLVEQTRQATERQRSLQLEIDKINETASRNQLSRDESEVASVKDKYSKIKEEVRKFYADPKNKGLRVDIGGLQRSENFEVAEATTRQETKSLTESLAVQKQLLDEYNTYAEQTSKAEADKRYSTQLASFKGYKDRLQKEYLDLITLETSGGTGEFKGSTVKLTQAQEERAKALRLLLDSLDKEERDRESKRMIESLKLSETYDQKRLAIEKKYQDAYATLNKNGKATDDQRQRLAKQQVQELSELALANFKEDNNWNEIFSTIFHHTKSQAESSIKELKSGLDRMLKEGKITIVQYQESLDQIIGIKARLSTSDHGLLGELKQQIAILRELKKGTLAYDDQNKNVADAANSVFQTSLNIVGDIKGIFDDLNIGSESLREGLGKTVETLGHAGNLAASIAKGDVLGSVANGVKFLSSAIDLFNTKDKKLQKQIDAYKGQLDALGKSYDTLQSKMNGSDTNYYANSDQLIANLKQRQVVLNQMAQAEEDKKKTDKEKVKGYYEEIDSVAKQIEDIELSVRQMRLQTDINSLSQSITDALLGAFEAGEEGIESMDKAFDKFIKNAIVNSARIKMINPIIEDMVNQLDKYMAGNDNSAVGFDFNKWREKLASVGKTFNESLESAYQGLGLEKDGTSTSGGLKGAIQKEMTEATASQLTGLYRATFELQKLTLEESKSNGLTLNKQLLIAMDQLNVLNAIKNNTGETVKKLDNAVSELQSINKNLSGSKGRTSEGMGL